MVRWINFKYNESAAFVLRKVYRAQRGNTQKNQFFVIISFVHSKTQHTDLLNRHVDKSYKMCNFNLILCVLILCTLFV